jgi:asparagine N-glycosylation enzyme membrane subunit Stt3
MLSQTRKPILERRWFIPLALIMLAALAFLFRCLHLFDQEHYYILSPDSYFFHWVARGVMAGEPPPISPGAASPYTLHSGLAYPLAYIARAMSYVFGTPSSDALELVSKLLPPLLGILSMLVIYLAAARMFDRRVGLFAALTWAFISPTMLLSAAGFIDRDSLSILLVMMGAFLFYLSVGFHLRVGGRDIGWAVAGLGVLVIEALLYMEWTYVGPAFLLAIVVVYFVVKFLLEYFRRVETEPSAWRRINASVRETNWRICALVIALNLAVIGLWAVIYPGEISSGVSLVRDMIQARLSGESEAIAELQGLSILDFLGYQLFLIPIIAGIYSGLRRRSEGVLFATCWFLCLLLASVLSRRIMLYAIPAACVLSGVGLGAIWSWQGWKRYADQISSSLAETGLGYVGTWRCWGWLREHGAKVITIGLVCLAIVFSFITATGAAVGYGMSPDRDWQEALGWIKDESNVHENAIIMSQWSWGYWILDLGERKPLVDNGYYGYDSERLHDVAMAYFTSDPEEAAQLMQKWGADYLVFSTLDRKVAKTIMGWADVGEGLDSFPVNSLVERSLTGQFDSGGGLEVVYRSGPGSGTSADYEVVVLRLRQS